MRIIYNAKYLFTIHLKFGNKFLTSLIKLVLKAKASTFFTIKENALFYSRKFSACVAVVINYHIFIIWPVETPLVIATVNFTIKSLAFQNRQLNIAHSISDIKLP